MYVTTRNGRRVAYTRCAVCGVLLTDDVTNAEGFEGSRLTEIGWVCGRHGKVSVLVVDAPGVVSVRKV